MAARQFTEGERFQWQERGWRVERRLPNGQIVIGQLATGVAETHDLAHLEQALFDGELAFEVRGRQARAEADAEVATGYRYLALDDCPEHIAQEARLRYAFTRPLWELEPGQRTEDYIAASIDQFWEKLSDQEREVLGPPISVRTARRWLRLLTASEGDLRGLISNLSNSGAAGQSRLDACVEAIIADVIHRMVLIRTPYALPAIHDEILLRIHEENQGRVTADRLPAPSRATVARRIRRLDQARVLARQQGRQAGKAATEQFGHFEVPELPNQRWEIDGTTADIVILDREDDLPIGRLTLLACIDVCTKVITGVAIAYEESYLAVAECLYNAIRKGPSTREMYGTVNDVCLYGLPDALAYDIGKAFENQHLADACALLGIHADPTPGRTPEAKPFIERFLGTLSGQVFHVAPGTTFSNVLQRGDYPSEKLACLYQDELEWALHLFIADIYSQDSHAGLGGRTPAQVLDGFYQGGFEPRLPPSADELSIVLGQVAHRTLDKNGFMFQHLRYNHPALGRLRARLGGRGKIKIKYQADDLGQMYVYDEFGQGYVEVPALDQDYARGLSLWKHRLIRAYANENYKLVDRLALARARRELAEIFRTSADRKRASRFNQTRKAAWRSEHNPAAPEPFSLAATRDEATQAEYDAIFAENQRIVQAWADEVLGPDDEET